MNKFKANLSVVLSAAVIWSTSAAISYYSAKNYKENKRAALSDAPTLSATTQELLEKTKNSPNDVSLRLELAQKIKQDAFNSSNPNMLMQAVDEYKKVIELDANNSEALLGLAQLCLDAGIVDQAAKYFESYLKLQPDDLEVKTDYALSLIENNQIEQAEKILKENIQKNINLKNVLSLSLAYKAKGDNKMALEHANQALALAQTDKERQKVNEYLSSIGKINPHEEIDNNVSPAKLIETYFKSHEIISAKLASINWSDANTVLLKMNNFPVDKMPDFAKEKMIVNIKEKFKGLQQLIKIKFVSAETNEELLLIEVGNRAAKNEKN